VASSTIRVQTHQLQQDALMSDATTNTDSNPLHRWILIAVRVGLVIAIAISVSFPEWEQFAGKGMAFRAPFYLLPTIVVPIVWRMRGSHPTYPYLVDALVVAPFVLDTLGNVLNFYNNFDRTDDVLHFFNWVLLMGGVTLAFARLELGRLTAWTGAFDGFLEPTMVKHHQRSRVRVHDTDLRPFCFRRRPARRAQS